jgi:hypothetical protein
MFFNSACCMLCRYWPLRWADQSFRGVQPAVCVCDLETLTIRRPKVRVGLLRHRKQRKGADLTLQKIFRNPVTKKKVVSAVTELTGVYS